MDQIALHKELESYFELVLGEGAIVGYQYLQDLPNDLVAKRPYNTAGIVHELGFVQLNNRMICRFGIGYYWPQRLEIQNPPTAGLSAECAPLGDDLLNSTEPLDEKFLKAQDLILGSQLPMDTIIKNVATNLNRQPIGSLSIERRRNFLDPVHLFYLGGRPFQNASPIFRAFSTIDFKVADELTGEESSFSYDAEIWQKDLSNVCAGILLQLQADNVIVPGRQSLRERFWKHPWVKNAIRKSVIPRGRYN